MKTCLIITGGPLDLEFANRFLKKVNYDLLIAVDAGLERADQLGVIPHAIVGDFDTVEPQILAKYQSYPNILWDIHQPEKDETDTELAFYTALKLNSDQIFMLGSTGGRLDHTLANIQLLYLCLANEIPAYLVDPQNKTYLISQNHVFEKATMWGNYISFLPFSDHVKGLTLEGFKYPLTQRYLRKGHDSGLCISNEIIAHQSHLFIEDGIVICIESKD